MSFCIACRRSARNTFQLFTARVLPVIVIAALLSPAIFVVFSVKTEASGKRSRKDVTAPPSAPPEPFVIGAQPSNPMLTILAVEALSSIKTSVLAMFADVSVARTSVRASSESENAETVTQPAPPQPASIVDFDFDNDGKTDIGRWKPGTSEFEIDPSGGGANLVYDIGSSTSKFVPGDFNGDGSVDAAVFDSGTWTYKTSPGASAQTISFGQSGDVPMPADYNADGTTDAAVFRPSTNVWWILPSGGSYYSVSFGAAGDVPVTGDFDGDGLADQAVFRPSTGVWHINGSQAGYYGSGFGVASDVPVPADYDGDGMTDIAVYRGSTGTWYVQTSGSGPDITQVWGNYGDQPVPGYYDGNAVADLAVWRPSTGVWYIAKSSGGYEYHTLGVPGDRAVPSAFVKQIGGEVAPYELAKARLSPKNATGGTDLYSQNFSWGTSLVGLPGRAGLNAGFGMSYNSLVWTKEGSNVHFDTNYDNISPGFRFGFPTIEAPYYVPGTGETANPYFAYVMVSPSGARTEFRQIGASELFETADSSYLQLETEIAPDPNTPVEDITLTVRGTDGTQMSYVWIAGAFRCTQILDRNGNYITIDHSEYGQLTKVTDTLGREINVNYSEDLYPTTITQTWKDTNGSGSNTTHTWATFAYTTKTVATDFDGVTNVGPPNDTVIKVLEKVTYPDASYTKFHYNGYIQVWKVENYAANNDLLNHVRTNLESPAADQADSPKFTATWNKAANFNSGNEIKINNSLTLSQSVTLPGSLPNTSGTKIEVWMDGHPYDAVTKTIVGASGWQEGLTLATEEWADDVEGGTNARQRWTWNEWTQDDTGSADILNPRITETRVGDSTNTKKTEIDYLLYPSTTISKFGLVSEVRVYDSDLSTILKQQQTDYNLNSAYIDRRIIGLPAEVRSYGRETSGLNLMSKMTYAFDEGNFGDSGLNQNISPVQHDNTNYGSSFITGRANLTSSTRWNVEYPTTSGEAVTSSQKYNTAGAVVSKTDPASRTVKIGYADNFNSSPGVSTWAYPTSLTDPASNSSTVKYRYDIGANVEANSPAPTGQTYGKTSKRVYDSIGRLERDSVYINTTEHAYTRYEFPTNGVQVKSYSTLVDTDSDGADADDEVLSESWSDGAGRVRLSRLPHTFSGGSTSTWAGTITEYDILGRVKRQSVPSEVDGSWAAAGDDYTRGFLWTYQKYDWQGRVVRKIATDGIDQATLNDSDVLISYAGCGCAGGLETTIQSESVPRDDTPTVNARRTQKVYSDILGRAWKTEVMNWDGTTPYTTTVQTFNGRDQVTQTRQYAGSTSSTTYQDVSLEYDGHGRTKTRHYPIEDAEAETTWSYNTDDSVQQIIDPRGAITAFTYNSRGLTTEVAYTPSGSIPDTPTTTFAYDNLGNRTSMDTAGVNETTYAYDSLSRMTSETIDFDDLTSNYTISYDYQLSGKLKTVTDPFSAVVNYNDDKVGRTTSVTGSGFGSVSTYADDIQFRAFGAVKQMTYGSSDNSTTSYEFDNRLRIDSYQSTSSVVSGGYVRKATYDYLADGQTKAVDNIVDARFDQAYRYDHMGRMTSSESGLVTNSQDEEVPAYAQGIQYNAFGEMTSRGSDVWGNSDGFTATYINGRKQNSDEIYDASGNIVENPTLNPEIYDKWKFDASGRVVETESRWYQGAPQQTSFDRTHEVEQAIDGDGQIIKRTETKTSVQIFPSNTSVDETTEYFVRSSVLGGKILTELKPDGTKSLTNVYAGKGIIAEQVVSSSGSTVSWRHEDLVTGSFQKVSQSGTPFPYGDPQNAAEFEPLGGAIPETDPNPEEPDLSPFPDYRWGGDVQRPESGCAWDGTPIQCEWIGFIVNRAGSFRINVNIRAEGGWNAYYGLRSSISVWHYRKYRIDPSDTESPVTIDDDGPIQVEDNTHLVAEWFEILISPMWETMIPQQQTAKFDERKFRTCVKDLFNTDVDSYEIGKKFNGRSRDTLNILEKLFEPLFWLFNVELSAFEINTKSIPSAQLGYMVGGPLLGGAGNVVYGWTYDHSFLFDVGPENNFVVSDVGVREFQEAIWVYELGNALGYITENKPVVQDPGRYENVSVHNKDDVGGALMDCVYGGAVNPMGRIRPPRTPVQ